MIHASAIAESIIAPTLFRPAFSHSLDPKRTLKAASMPPLIALSQRWDAGTLSPNDQVDEGIKVASSCERGDVYRHRAREALSGFPEIHAFHKDARGRTSFRRSAMITPSLGHDGQFARFA